MSNRSRSERYSRVPGPFRVRVTARRTVNGQTFYTAVNPRTAEVYPWCALQTGSGGTRDVFVHAPVRLPDEGETVSPFDAPEALLTFDTKGAAYLSGLLQADEPDGLSETPPDLDDADLHPGTFTPRDYVIANGKARVIVDADGNVLVRACRSLRLQVGDDGEGGRVVVLSTEGDAQSEVVLYDPLREHLDALRGRLDEVSQALADVYTRMAATASGTAFANPFTGGAMSFGHVPAEPADETLATPYLSAPQRRVD